MYILLTGSYWVELCDNIYRTANPTGSLYDTLTLMNTSLVKIHFLWSDYLDNFTQGTYIICQQKYLHSYIQKVNMALSTHLKKKCIII